MSRSTVCCEICDKKAVVCVRTDDKGVEAWRCNQCGDLKHLCPRCDGQGWVRRMRVKELSADLYSCDGCDATWLAVENIGSAWIDLQTLLDARLPAWTWNDLTVIRETETTPVSTA